ncbi:hypothetical protein AAGW05_02175 [Arthrobacter sp. LAPM80]|uniref:hypothetical protein n=1 Tax=Arthrobacter sp. LAPM80 TaxID=3141788 RepID=UPI00398A8A34
MAGASRQAATCTKPGTGAGECGVGVTSGQKLSFTLQYSSGNQTTTERGPAVMQAYENALAKDVPVIWQPHYTYSLTRVANALKGVTPQSPYGNLTPEEWHY